MKVNLVIRLTAALFVCAVTACQSTQPPALRDYPDFAKVVKDSKGRFLGCFDYAISVPGVPENFWATHSLKDVYPIPGTSDEINIEDGNWFNDRAFAFAREYNAWLLRKKL